MIFIILKEVWTREAAGIVVAEVIGHFGRKAVTHEWAS
jgi:hypothetical protein